MQKESEEILKNQSEAMCKAWKEKIGQLPIWPRLQTIACKSNENSTLYIICIYVPAVIYPVFSPKKISTYIKCTIDYWEEISF